MRKLLFENLIRLPLTEPAPSPSDAAMEELIAAIDKTARRALGAACQSAQSMPVPVTAASWRCTR